MPFRQSPPAILALHHEGKLGSGGKGELVQKLNLQARADECIQNLAQVMVPNVLRGCFTFYINGIGYLADIFLWFMAEEIRPFRPKLPPGLERKTRNIG
jgi:hypothetical protein